MHKILIKIYKLIEKLNSKIYGNAEISSCGSVIRVRDINATGGMEWGGFSKEKSENKKEQ